MSPGYKWTDVVALLKYIYRLFVFAVRVAHRMYVNHRKD